MTLQEILIQIEETILRYPICEVVVQRLSSASPPVPSPASPSKGLQHHQPLAPRIQPLPQSCADTVCAKSSGGCKFRDAQILLSSIVVARLIALLKESEFRISRARDLVAFPSH